MAPELRKLKWETALPAGGGLGCQMHRRTPSQVFLLRKTKGRMEGMGREGNEGLAHRRARILELAISPYCRL